MVSRQLLCLRCIHVHSLSNNRLRERQRSAKLVEEIDALRHATDERAKKPLGKHPGSHQQLGRFVPQWSIGDTKP